jgi:signal transduction histidine kinase
VVEDERKVRLGLEQALPSAGYKVVTAATGNDGLARADGRTVVAVANTGEGLAAEHLSRVFDRFYRVDEARSREMGGTGLGLVIAKSIVTAHGGRIELTGAVGAGTTATAALPLAPAPDP